MVITLALIEAGALFGVVCSMMVFWLRPVVLDWLDAALLFGRVMAVTGCCSVAFYYNELYNFRLVRDFAAFVPRLLQSFGVAFILLAGFYLLFPDLRIANGPFICSVLLVATILVPLRGVSYIAMRRHFLTERVLLVGASPLAHSLVAEIDAHLESRCMVVGIADDTAAEGATAPYPLLGPLTRLEKVIEETRPDRIIVTMSERRGRLPVRQLLAARGSGIAVDDGVHLYERLAGKLAIESLAPSGLLFAADFRRARVHAFLSRAISLSASLIAVVLVAPLLVLIAAAIKLDSAGSILFIQDRVGRGGRPFRLLKFRTMRPATREATAWVVDNHHRITRVGKWLRKFRLDELPQFVNIVCGDMNLVGPRPHPVCNFELFNDRIPYYSLRATVRPGVTGWAQVRYGYANDLTEEIEKMRHDLYYIKHRSVWLDLRILADSVKIVLLGRGAR
jgi:exopolysaccharide biosynthesis polyprenyl glycosylphosphotransferase